MCLFNSYFPSVSGYDRAQERKRELQLKYETGIPRITASELLEAAVQHGGYETPELNDVLYLHYKGYKRIENLEAYTGLKALFLDTNGLVVIENLGSLVELRSLYLQQNVIERMGGFEGLNNLVTLNLSSNRIRVIENLNFLPSLTTLAIAKNELATKDDVHGLVACPTLTSIDFSSNKLASLDILDVLEQLPKLSATNMVGNPVVNEARHFRCAQYRACYIFLRRLIRPYFSRWLLIFHLYCLFFSKNVILRLPALGYLDRPVFPEERASVVAWGEGGVEAEREARAQWRAREVQEHK